MEREQIFIPMAVNKYNGQNYLNIRFNYIETKRINECSLGIGCSSEEKLKAGKIFKIYLDGKAEINK